MATYELSPQLEMPALQAICMGVEKRVYLLATHTGHINLKQSMNHKIYLVKSTDWYQQGSRQILLDLLGVGAATSAG